MSHAHGRTHPYQMDKQKLDLLAALLTEFVAFAQTTPNASFYGKRMDIALARDTRSVLIAYGADYDAIRQASNVETERGLDTK